MSLSPRKFVALDTDFLLALAAGGEDHASIVDWFGDRDTYCMVTATVLQELQDIKDNDPKHGNLAGDAIANITVWGFYSTPLAPVENGVALSIAQKLAAKKIIEGEINDGLALAEAALQGCEFIITDRPALVNAPDAALKLALSECHVREVIAASPQIILDYIRLSLEKP
jgi:hypothetical protein